MPGKFGTHGDRKRAADQAREHGEDQVDRADILVVRRKHIAPPTRRMGMLFVVSFDDGGHVFLSRPS
jgi:hypothetical protein